MLPKNPLDDLIQRLGGPKNVAEMTGRAKRMIHNGDGTYTYMSRVEGNIASLDEVRHRLYLDEFLSQYQTLWHMCCFRMPVLYATHMCVSQPVST